MPFEPTFPIGVLAFGAAIAAVAAAYAIGYQDGKASVWRIVGRDAADTRHRLFTGRPQP